MCIYIYIYTSVVNAAGGQINATQRSVRVVSIEQDTGYNCGLDERGWGRYREGVGAI